MKDVILSRDGKVYLGENGKAQGEPVGLWHLPQGREAPWEGKINGDEKMRGFRTKGRLRQWLVARTKAMRLHDAMIEDILAAPIEELEAEERERSMPVSGNQSTGGAE